MDNPTATARESSETPPELLVVSSTQNTAANGSHQPWPRPRSLQESAAGYDPPVKRAEPESLSLLPTVAKMAMPERSRSQNDVRIPCTAADAGSKDKRPPCPRLSGGGLGTPYLQSWARKDGLNQRRPASSFLEYLDAQGQFADEYPPERLEGVVESPFGCKKRGSGIATGKDFDKALEHGDMKGQKITGTKAVLLFLKGFIGTGVLFLPKAMKCGGLLFSMVLLVFMGFINFVAMLFLVRCRDKLGGSFGDIAGALFGPRVRTMVKISIILMQLGICCCYVIFVGMTVQDIVVTLSQGAIRWPVWVYIVLELVFYVPMSWIRKIEKLGGVVMVANVFIVLGLGYVYTNALITLKNNGVANDFKQMYPQAVYMNTSQFALFIGVSIFSFEGIGLVIPIHEALEKPEQISGVLKIALAIVSIVFAGTGALCYLAYGSDTQDIAFENFDPEDSLGLAVQVVYAAAIILSVPLSMFPAIRILETSIFPPSEGVIAESVGLGPLGRILSNVSGSGRTSLKSKWFKNLLRTSLCVVAVAIGLAGSSDIEKFVNLVGAFACVPLMFIYPGVFHYKAVATTKVEKLADIFLVITGLAAMVFVTVMTIAMWIGETVNGGS